MNDYSKILKTIQKFETIIIHRHVRPDPDALGSQVGLQKLLQYNYPSKRILVTGIDEPSLGWLSKMDEVKEEDYQGALVIVTDTANKERIDDQRYLLGAQLIKIDHHPNDEPYGDIVWVDTTASSCSEMIARFAFDHDLEVTPEIAFLLYAGILGDTGRFLYPSTTAKTFDVAGRLRQYDFDFAGLSRRMDSMDYRIAKLTGYVYDHLEVDQNGAARVILSQETLAAYQVTDADTSAIVPAPGRIDAVQTWAVFVEQKDGSYRVRLRSKAVPINTIAKEHGGGGHPLASGANSYSLAENDAIYQEIQEAVANAVK